MNSLHLRPRGFTEIIDATFQIVRSRFKALATIAALMIIPASALTLYMVAVTPQAAIPAGGEGEPVVVGPLAGPDLSLGFIPLAILAFLFYFFASAALIDVASGAYLGRPADVPAAFARARRRFWPLLGATFAKYLRVMGLAFVGVIVAAAAGAAAGAGAGGAGFVVSAVLFIVLVPAAIVLMLRWAITAPIAVLEDVSGGAALQRSAALTDGRKWPLFALFFVLFVLLGALSATFQYVGMFVLRSFTLAQVFTNGLSLFTYPFTAVLLTVLYYDLRIRNEGFDLEVMAAGLEEPAPTPVAARTTA